MRYLYVWSLRDISIKGAKFVSVMASDAEEARVNILKYFMSADCDQIMDVIVLSDLEQISDKIAWLADMSTVICAEPKYVIETFVVPEPEGPLCDYEDSPRLTISKK